MLSRLSLAPIRVPEETSRIASILDSQNTIIVVRVIWGGRKLACPDRVLVSKDGVKI